MQIKKLLSILRNPYGIESHIVKNARLEAADIIENTQVRKNDYLTDLTTAQAKVQECLSAVDVNKVHIQKESTDFDPDDFTSVPTSAPKNHISENKPNMAELPLDLLSDLLCPAYQEGCLKYERNSWRKGFKMSIMLSACLRHITKFYFSRETYDTETLITYGIKKHHLGAAIFCLIAMYNDWKYHSTNDDRLKP